MLPLALINAAHTTGSHNAIAAACLLQVLDNLMPPEQVRFFKAYGGTDNRVTATTACLLNKKKVRLKEWDGHKLSSL